MNQESGAAVHVAAQQTQAFVGSVPGFDHDVIQLITQKVFDHALVARLHFKEICQHAYRGQSTLHDSRLEEATNRFRGISMLRDDGLERSLPAERRSEFGSEKVEPRLGFGFVE